MVLQIKAFQIMALHSEFPEILPSGFSLGE